MSVLSRFMGATYCILAAAFDARLCVCVLGGARVGGDVDFAELCSVLNAW